MFRGVGMTSFSAVIEYIHPKIDDTRRTKFNFLSPSVGKSDLIHPGVRKTHDTSLIIARIDSDTM